MSEVVPDLMTPLVGWRVWRLYPQNPWLFPRHTASDPWLPRVAMVAHCTLQPTPYGHISADKLSLRPAPIADCTCGVYAYKTFPPPTEPGSFNPTWERSHEFVVGQVSLWGTVIEHTHGYRAQYAYPKTLTVFDPDLKAPLEDRYQVPVTVEAAEEDAADEAPVRDALFGVHALMATGGTWSGFPRNGYVGYRPAPPSPFDAQPDDPGLIVTPNEMGTFDRQQYGREMADWIARVPEATRVQAEIHLRARTTDAIRRRVQTAWDRIVSRTGPWPR